MALNRLQAVGTTGGRKAAAWPDHRRDETPVEPDQRQHQERHGAVETATKLIQRADGYSGWFVHGGMRRTVSGSQHARRNARMLTTPTHPWLDTAALV